MMKSLLIILIALLAMSACNAKTDTPPAEVAHSPDKELVETTEQAPLDPVTYPAPEGPKAPAEPVKPKEITPLVTFIELGAESCIPCRMMQPVMKEISGEYKGTVKVIFIDLYKDKEAAQKYGVRVMPTQVFLDAQGREFFRHEGFYPKAEIEKMLADKMGVRKPQ